MKLKTFQKQDLARAALHDGLILSWDTGLWKTGAGYLWPLLKVGFEQVANDPACRVAPPALYAARGPTRLAPCKPVLIVAPGDLHHQGALEGVEKFNIETFPLDSQDTFMALTHSKTRDARSQTLPPAFYITSYTQLTTNGVQRIPDAMDCDDPVALMQTYALKNGPHQDLVSYDNNWLERPDFATACEFFAWRGIKWKDDFFRLGIEARSTLKELTAAFDREIECTQSIRVPELRAEAVAKLQESFDVIKHLVCARPDPELRYLAPAQQNFVLRHFLADKFARYAATVGAVHEYEQDEAGAWHPLSASGGEGQGEVAPTRPRRRIECIYSPSLADLCHDAFACVVVDEGVKMKGEDTYVGLGVRKMNPPYRLVLTATPVKNRLPDIFRLAWWAAGGKAEAHARFPYKDDPEERAKFANTFMVSEHNLTKDAKAREAGRNTSSGRFKKLTAEVCNIHRLWKLLGPIVLRRRKQDCGEEIVPKIRKVVRCEMGTLQQQVYQYHLEASYLDCNGKPAVGAQLQALRIAAADPTSAHLTEQSGRLSLPCQCTHSIPASAEPSTLNPQPSTSLPPDPACPRCHGSGEIPLIHRSGQAFTPKMATVLTLIEEILARKEQVVVGSAFNDPLDRLSEWLTEAGVRHCKLDGRVSQKRRGVHAAKFKQGRHTTLNPQPSTLNPSQDGGAIPVMLAGVECMSEGHSFHLANNVILFVYSWAYDKFIQFLARIHRLNSAKPVNVYVVLCSGTIDRRLESLIQDKGDAAELVLDGRLIGERTEEVNLAELLNIARKEFETSTKTIDEAMLQATWPALRDKLAASMRAWDPEPSLPGRAEIPLCQPDKSHQSHESHLSHPNPQPPPREAESLLRGQPREAKPFTRTQPPTKPMNGRRNTHPNIQPIQPATAGVAPVTIPQPSTLGSRPSTPVNDWRARLKARVALMEKSATPDIWNQL